MVNKTLVYALVLTALSCGHKWDDRMYAQKPLIYNPLIFTALSNQMFLVTTFATFVSTREICYITSI